MKLRLLGATLLVSSYRCAVADGALPRGAPGAPAAPAYDAGSGLDQGSIQALLAQNAALLRQLPSEAGAPAVAAPAGSAPAQNPGANALLQGGLRGADQAQAQGQGQGQTGYAQFAPWLAAQEPLNGPGMRMASRFAAGSSPQMAQMQYSTQLEQYAQQQQRMAEWVKQLQQYQQTYGQRALGATGYQQYQQAYGAPPTAPQAPQVPPVAAQAYYAPAQEQPVLPRGPRVPDLQGGSLMQVQAHSGVSQERRAEQSQQAAAQEAALRQEAAQLQAREAADAKVEAQLNARAAALADQEQRVSMLQSQILKEQQKMFKVLQARRQPAIANQAVASAAVAPPQPQRQPQGPPQPRQLPPQQLEQAAAAQAPARPRPSLMQLGADSRASLRGAGRASAGARVAVRSASKAASRAAARSAGKGVMGEQVESDLQVIVAAKAVPPAPGASAPADSDDNEDSKFFPSPFASDEDSASSQKDARMGENADNDDAEQMALVQTGSSEEETTDAEETDAN